MNRQSISLNFIVWSTVCGYQNKAGIVSFQKVHDGKMSCWIALNMTVFVLWFQMVLRGFVPKIEQFVPMVYRLLLSNPRCMITHILSMRPPKHAWLINVITPVLCLGYVAWNCIPPFLLPWKDDTDLIELVLHYYCQSSMRKLHFGEPSWKPEIDVYIWINC